MFDFEIEVHTKKVRVSLWTAVRRQAEIQCSQSRCQCWTSTETYLLSKIHESCRTGWYELAKHATKPDSQAIKVEQKSQRLQGPKQSFVTESHPPPLPTPSFNNKKTVHLMITTPEWCKQVEKVPVCLCITFEHDYKQRQKFPRHCGTLTVRCAGKSIESLQNLLVSRVNCR